MLKLIFALFSMLFIYGGCNMTEAVSTSEDGKTIKQRIREHAQKTLSIPSNKISIKKAESKSKVSGVQEYFVAEEGRSSGGSHTYFVYEDNLYCSSVEEDFGKFLKDYEFLKKDELDADWFLYVLKRLKNYQNQIVILEERINKPSNNLKPFLEKISIPKLEKTDDGGATFTFFTQSPMTLPITKYVVNVSPDYAVTIENNFVEP